MKCYGMLTQEATSSARNSMTDAQQMHCKLETKEYNRRSYTVMRGVQQTCDCCEPEQQVSFETELPHNTGCRKRFSLKNVDPRNRLYMDYMQD